MSRQLINEYRAELGRLRAVSGSRRESVLREAFKDLLKRWGKSHSLQFVAEHDILTKAMTRIYVDGALLHGLRVPFGYWEAKDESDDLDMEIVDKFRKGYPRDNIVFTDDRTAVLWQDGVEVLRAEMQTDDGSLLALLTRFFAHERQEIADFNKAVKQFAADLPAILNALRDRIAEKHAASSAFAKAVADFLKHARDAINPTVSEDDVREMLIQHILTEDIFAKVFNDPEFHRKNNVAAELYKLEEKLFDRGEKATLLRALDPYYAGIASTAALIQSHSEKQGFLKALYEDFYKAYNRKAADRLGVVYTPDEIVRFMIQSADWLCEKHFGKNLIDRGVEILDPATGTGTFIVELLEHFRGDHVKLSHKYRAELHANEVAILPYYVANLNIEATYSAIMTPPGGNTIFEEFENLCLVDTLDNVAALGIYSGHQFDLLGGLSDENVERIKRQNRRKISVIIGNPPYNAWQEDFNQKNANRYYQRVDQRINQTYVRESNATNSNSVYDMYTRFFRWASDRLGNEGIVAFVMGRKPITKDAYDGFRAIAEREFADIHLLDLGGDIRDNPRLNGKTHNVFGIKVGVMIAFFVKRKHSGVATISYARRPEFETATDKLAFLSSVGQINAVQSTRLSPDKRHNWIHIADNDWSGWLPMAGAKPRRKGDLSSAPCIFALHTNGTETGRDEWLWGWNSEEVVAKTQLLIRLYNGALDGNVDIAQVKMDRQLQRRFDSSARLHFCHGHVRQATSAPFIDKHLYYDRDLNAYMYNLGDMYIGEDNPSILYLGKASSHQLAVLGTGKLFDFGVLKSGNGRTQGVSRFRYTKSGERVDNITGWALNKFIAEYGRKGVTKDAIFHYVYAVLHDPIYRETYALNLKREFPRIPFYADFGLWVAWGEQLMALHVGYKQVEPWPIQRVDMPNSKRAEGTHPRPILKSVPEQGLVRIDEDTQLADIPPEAWEYRLGNRSAIDWVLDQHKAKTPRDPIIREKFNTYRFADHKESMITLLTKVVRVSVDTVAITNAMSRLDHLEREARNVP